MIIVVALIGVIGDDLRFSFRKFYIIYALTIEDPRLSWMTTSIALLIPVALFVRATLKYRQQFVIMYCLGL